MERSGREEYAFLQAVVRLLRPLRILEVGTSDGGSALIMASAMAGYASLGELVTIDIADQRSDALRSFVAPPLISFMQGDSASLLASMVEAGERFDLVFIDGGHHYAQVHADWSAARQLADTIIFHDALQFKGVDRVIRQIRSSREWDVCVLDYPAVTEASGGTNAPGLAMATKVKPFAHPSFDALPGRPTRNSRRAWQRWKPRLMRYLNIPLLAGDLGAADVEMLFHLLWEHAPQGILHAGHAGSLASCICMEYARARKSTFLAWDPEGTFLPGRLQALPADLATALAAHGRNGPEYLPEILPMLAGNCLVIIDLYKAPAASFLYGQALPEMLAALRDEGIILIRNFSPYRGETPLALETATGPAYCTLPGGEALHHVLERGGVTLQRALPEAVFGDYVNAGHWLYVKKP